LIIQTPGRAPYAGPGHILRDVRDHEMYVVIRDTLVPRHYLTYDASGNKAWTTRRLDATIFQRKREARECCDLQLHMGAKLKDVGRDGAIIAYRNVELQIFWHGGCWRFRVASTSGDWQYGRKGRATPNKALAYGKKFVKHMLPVL
jgi:hypothetical protein